MDLPHQGSLLDMMDTTWCCFGINCNQMTCIHLSFSHANIARNFVSSTILILLQLDFVLNSLYAIGKGNAIDVLYTARIIFRDSCRISGSM